MAGSQYVVEVEVAGFLRDGDTDPNNDKPYTKAALTKANKAKLASVERPDVTLVDTLVRDDGTGILWFEWDPPSDGGAATWQAAKDYTEQVRSAAATAFQVIETRIGLHEA